MEPIEAVNILARITEEVPMIPAVCHKRDQAILTLRRLAEHEYTPAEYPIEDEVSSQT